MKIINIGSHLKNTTGIEIASIDFFSNDSFLDGDVIFWDMSYAHARLSSLGQQSTNKESYNFHLEIFQSRKNELKDFFALGRRMVIISASFSPIMMKVDTPNGIKEYTFNFADLFPNPNMNQIKQISKNGTNIISVKSPVLEDFFNKYSKALVYRQIFTGTEGKPLMYVKDTKKIVSKFFKVDKGKVFLLPFVQISGPSNIANFINDLLRFTGTFKIEPQGKWILPEWAKNYFLPQEQKNIDSLEEYTKQKKELEEKILEQQEIIKEQQKLKVLFTGQDKALEIIIEKVLSEIGFELEEPEKNEDDLILHFNGKVGVVEIKGTKKSSAQKHAVQLQKWVTNYHLKKEIDPKGILIVNPFIETEVSERNKNPSEYNFPPQMMKYVNQMQHCVMTSLQLLYLYIDFKKGIITKDEIGNKLFNTVGILTYSTTPKGYLEKK